MQDKNLKKLIAIDASKYKANKALYDEIEGIQKDLKYYQNQQFTEAEILEVLDGNHTLLLEKIESTKKANTNPKPKATPKAPAKKKPLTKEEKGALVATDITSCRRVISIYRQKQREEELREAKATAIANAKNSSERRKLEKAPLEDFKEEKPKLTVPEKVEQELTDLIEYVVNQRALTFGKQAKLRKRGLKKTKQEAVKKAVNGIKQLVLTEGREAYTEIISKIVD
ncbi:hypothetical protein BKI52_33010 [marine bacterium AO1-C]|nr:hypothetical protein BKI52_33010 [marine bacterium AO1-C]